MKTTLEVSRLSSGKVVARRKKVEPVTELTNESLRELRRLVSLVDGRAIRARIQEVK